MMRYSIDMDYCPIIYWTSGIRSASVGPRWRPVMASEAKLLTIEFLKWVAARPRSVVEARQAWSSTCPLNCAWEDAITEDLIEHGAGGRLALTARGCAKLAKARVAPVISAP